MEQDKQTPNLQTDQSNLTVAPLPVPIKEKGFFKSKKNVAMIYSVVGLFIVLGFVFAIFLIANGGKDPDDLTSNEKEEILGEISRNNPKGLFDNFAAGNLEDEGNSPIDPSFDPSSNAPIPVPSFDKNGNLNLLTPDDVIAPNINVYNYRVTTTHITPGEAYDDCVESYGCGGGMYHSDEENTSVYYEYFDNDRSFYKNINYDSDGDLQYYHLGKYGKTINEYSSYRGGSIVGLSKYEIYPEFSNTYRLNENNPSNPSSYAISYAKGENIIVDRRLYVGQNAIILDIYEEDGIEFYDVQSSYTSRCYRDTTFREYEDKTFFTIYKINSENYQIVKTQKYVDSVEDENLILTVETEVERSKVAYNTVSDVFDFEYEASEVVVDYSNYEYNAVQTENDLKNYVANNNHDVLTVLPTGSFTMSALKFKDGPERVLNERYYLRREFYPDTIKGQDDYDNLIESRKQSGDISINYERMFIGGTKDYFNMSVYFDRSADSVYDSIFNYYDSTRYSEEEINLMINGEEVSARKKYLINDYTYGEQFRHAHSISYPASYPVSFPEYKNFRHISLFVVFEYNGNTYSLTNTNFYGYTYDKNFVENYQYEVLNTGNGGHLERINNMITRSFEGNSYQYSY